LLLGMLTLGRMIGVRELVEGGADLRTRPTVRVWARPLRLEFCTFGGGEKLGK